eukprot:4810908-Pleurochrysis_carterae.AAC.1
MATPSTVQRHLLSTAQPQSSVTAMLSSATRSGSPTFAAIWRANVSAAGAVRPLATAPPSR